MEWKDLTGTVTEPVTHDEVKVFLGVPASDTSQDTYIDNCIIAARKWLEKRTALSIVSKSYKAYFEEDEAEDGWYELPFSPVLATPVITVEMNSVSTTFQQRGLKVVRIMPDSIFGTINVGVTPSTSYVEVTFQAGESNEEANDILLHLVSISFNDRNGGALTASKIPYSLLQRIDSLTII